MRKLLLTAIAVLLAPLAVAETAGVLARNYNLDSTSYVYPTYCSGVATAQSPQLCPAGFSSGNFVGDRPATTSGSASTTVTSVGSKDSFAGIAAGDLILFNVADVTTGAGTGQTLRQVISVTSNNSITVDSNVTLPTAGSSFSWWRSVAASTSKTAGWFAVGGEARALTVQVQIDQISVTGGIDYALECGVQIPQVALPPLTSDVVATGNLTATGTTTIAVAEPYTVCRLGLKIGTNDNLDTITNGANDKIDFSEGALVCAADIVAGSYTGADMAAAAQTAMNTAGICAGPASPGNAYTVSFNEVTGKYTITSNAASTATFSLLWNTGVNNAVAADTILGFAADLAGATTYTGAAVTHDTSTEAEQITVTVVRR